MLKTRATSAMCIDSAINCLYIHFKKICYIFSRIALIVKLLHNVSLIFTCHLIKHSLCNSLVNATTEKIHDLVLVTVNRDNIFILLSY